MPYLVNFGLEVSKTIVIYEISTLEFVKNKFLVHEKNFGIRSAFSEVMGPGPFDKVCPEMLKDSQKMFLLQV